jgi:predicted RND superfamily exporter protein
MRLFTIALALLMMSCGARKVNIAKTTFKKDSVSETSIKLNVETITNKIDTTNIRTQIETDEMVLTPIDTSKPISINNVLYKNVVLSIKKTKSNSLYTNIKKESETKRMDSVATNKVAQKTALDARLKETDKKSDYSYVIWITILILILYLLWQSKRFLLRR